jgi:hypothetical protein
MMVLSRDCPLAQTCHSREGGNLLWRLWITACAGMTA